MSGTPVEHRKLAREALAGLLAKGGDRTPIREFLIELLEAFLELDANVQQDFQEMAEQIAISTSIAEETKVLLRIAIRRFDISDSQSRMQLWTTMADALTGKPPEPQKGLGAGARHVPGAGQVARPKPGDFSKRS